MGLSIGEIIPKKEISFASLRGKIIAVDAFNALYQFLTTIRQADGTPLQDSQGNVTSHLSGLFYRNMNLILEGVKLIYVFDGEAPLLKEKTRAKRHDTKMQMLEKYNQAVADENIGEMRKYSSATVSLDAQKIEESKQLLSAMGVAIVQAPGEGEAQASWLVKKGMAYAVASQDYDCLLFEAPRLIQNLSLARKRKTNGGYREIFPQMIELPTVLSTLNVTQEQLVCLGILAGTDYNPGGVKGLGPKKSLKIVQEYFSREKIFEALEKEEKFSKYEINFDWKEIYTAMTQQAVDEPARIVFPMIDASAIEKIMTTHDFSQDRIKAQLDKLNVLKKDAAQKKLF